MTGPALAGRLRRGAIGLGIALVACASADPALDAIVPYLRGEAIVLLGEVHDNAHQHRLRLELLQRAFAAGWRPAIAMEAFDRERQAEIEQARRQWPGDARRLIDAAAPGGGGWNWAFYRPYVELALHYGVPLLAANLSNADTTRIVRGGVDAVFDARAQAALGLDRPRDETWRQAQEREIDAGHCHALPASRWPAMAAAQFARDAVMAEVLRRAGAGGRGVVLLAGNGHVRRDIGVPRWLAAESARVRSVGFLETVDDTTPPAAFDAVLRTAPADRPDPCAGFEARKPAR